MGSAYVQRARNARRESGNFPCPNPPNLSQAAALESTAISDTCVRGVAFAATRILGSGRVWNDFREDDMRALPWRRQGFRLLQMACIKRALLPAWDASKWLSRKDLGVRGVCRAWDDAGSRVQSRRVGRPTAKRRSSRLSLPAWCVGTAGTLRFGLPIACLLETIRFRPATTDVLAQPSRRKGKVGSVPAFLLSALARIGHGQAPRRLRARLSPNNFLARDIAIASIGPTIDSGSPTRIAGWS